MSRTWISTAKWLCIDSLNHRDNVLRHANHLKRLDETQERSGHFMIPARHNHAIFHRSQSPTKKIRQPPGIKMLSYEQYLGFRGLYRHSEKVTGWYKTKSIEKSSTQWVSHEPISIISKILIDVRRAIRVMVVTSPSKGD